VYLEKGCGCKNSYGRKESSHHKVFGIPIKIRSVDKAIAHRDTGGIALFLRTTTPFWLILRRPVQLALATVLLCTSGGRADDQVLQLVQPFYEAFLDSPPTPPTRGVVGAEVIGLRLGSADHSFEPAAIRILLSDGVPKPEQICAKFFTRDGRYFARGQYKLTGVTTPTPRVDFQTHYHRQLADYKAADFAMIALSDASCDQSKGAQLFVVDDGGAGNKKNLVVQIRAGDARVHAQLGRNNAAVSPVVLCKAPPDGPRIGFSAECTIELPVPFHAGLYQLSIGETATGGEMVVKTYSIVLAAAGGNELK
jgi:hypothetical protein